jgi:toxin FitB
MYILDTNVVSELREGKAKPDKKVLAWAESQLANQIFVTALTILALEKGVILLEQKTPPQGSALRLWLDGLRVVFSGRIIPFTEKTAAICAGLHSPRTRPERDAMIAASALEHHFTMVTRNDSDFKIAGLTVINPWK